MASRDSAFLWESEMLRSARPPSRRVESVETKEPEHVVESSSKEVDLTTEPEVPEGSMIVPLDAWNRMLNQLGNLHEAGQQLAEARERAAKAETEARFLKERLGELREQLEERDQSIDEDTADEATGASSGLQSTRALIRKVYSGWRKRRRT